MKYFVARKSGMIISVRPTDKPNVYQEIGGGQKITPDPNGERSRLFVGERAFETAEKWLSGQKVWTVGELTDEGVYHVITTHDMPTSGVFLQIEDAVKFCDARNK